ncbi:unnamed protein product [Microthlaspi erraticum]|uniref:Gnk2-homologous domain-containing protein n=1 Tax=Microthlaspi erraticum TaxID=1685480 RepID=A0A6D2L1D2_9BRAS|nr:unnamed protein product [Microthlaspi erraticum]
MSQPYHMNTYCDRDEFTRTSSYGSNRDTVLSNLRNSSSLGTYSNATTGLTPNKVYGMFLCRGDINTTSCSDCVHKATREAAKNCTNKKEAFIFYDMCMVRYSDFSFFTLVEDMSSVTVHSLIPSANTSQFFNGILPGKLKDLILRVSLSSPIPYFVEDQERVTLLERAYDVKAMVQCSPDLDPRNCTVCLGRAVRDLSGCCGNNSQVVWAQSFLPKCLVYYNISGLQPNQQPPNVVSLGFKKGDEGFGRIFIAIMTAYVLALLGEGI